LTGPPSALTQILANIVAAFSTADILAAGALSPDDKAGAIADLSLLGESGLLLAALTFSEVLNSIEGVSKVTTAMAEDAEAAKNLGAMEGALQALATISLHAGDQITTLQDTLNPIQNVVHVLNNAYSLQADSIYEKSNSGTLQSAGVGGTECLLSLDPLAPPAGGGIMLEYRNPVAQPLIQLNFQGVKIAAGVPNAGPQITLSPIPTQGLTLSYGQVCSITLNAQGITLAYGPPGAGSSITLNAAGITLTVGAATTLTLTPAAFDLMVSTFGVTTEGQFTVSAQNLLENVTGTVTRQSGVYSID
jgi:hypothetical protein